MTMGGSTNVVLHLLAIAHELGIPLDMEDFQVISDRTPLIADMKPGGEYVMADLDKLGGISFVLDRSVSYTHLTLPTILLV